jgi:hypothetical protein
MLEIITSAELLDSDYLYYYGTVSYLQSPRLLGLYVQYLWLDCTPLFLKSEFSINNFKLNTINDYTYQLN